MFYCNEGIGGPIEDYNVNMKNVKQKKRKHERTIKYENRMKTPTQKCKTEISQKPIIKGKNKMKY